MRKTTLPDLSKGETDVLLTLLQTIPYLPGAPEFKKEERKEMFPNIPFAARDRIISSLHQKIWKAWADMHPEEGPFK
ncbi:hypothetical protein POP12_191 [Pectobacterium phage POP12]|nr:hypothetical protein POP12_191 [Pectobacterium phage POP12]